MLHGILGAGGFAREVMPIAETQLISSGLLKNSELVFVVDEPRHAEINGRRIISTDEFLAAKGDKYFNIAIADSRVRERLAELLLADGATPFAVSSNNVVVLAASQIGSGAILCPFTTITSNARIGNFFHANLYSYVAHDCVIGDYVTFAPGVKCNGRVVIEDHAYIGTGAIIKQGTDDRPLVVGHGATVGMGAVVTRSVDAGTTVVGNPARPKGTVKSP